MKKITITRDLKICNKMTPVSLHLKLRGLTSDNQFHQFHIQASKTFPCTYKRAKYICVYVCVCARARVCVYT